MWQPIETLPRDGRSVLVWAEPMHEADIAWHDEEGTTLRTYTHWMALPKPPNAEPETKGGDESCATTQGTETCSQITVASNAEPTSNPEGSATPRTEAEAYDVLNASEEHPQGRVKSKRGKHTSADFARTLERENIQLRADYNKVVAERDEAKHHGAERTTARERSGRA